MMLTHTWIDQYAGGGPIGKTLRDAVAGAVQFDCGPTDVIPIGKGSEFCESRAPFQSTLLQFELPSNPNASHAIVLWQDQSDGSVQIIAAQRLMNKEWRSISPTTITRNADGSFHYERIGYDDSATQFVMMCHAQAMNLFYILGCSNVDTADNPAPAALNKKRARTGKFPILTHKTLVIVADAKRHEKANCGGTHTSPRVHLRRGHIRRVGESRRVWVQPCVVGSKHGVVTKDYKVVMG